MSAKAEAILEQFETLPPAEQRDLWRELQRRVAPVELHGAPLTDEDIADSARVTFAMLDEEEQRAKARRSPAGGLGHGSKGAPVLVLI